MTNNQRTYGTYGTIRYYKAYKHNFKNDKKIQK